MTESDRLSRVRAGDRRAMAALMRDLDDDKPGARDAVRGLAAGGVAAGATPFVVGITGAPGAGKSTIVDALIAHFRAGGRRVGVVAIDPTSPIGGGAVLGDRVRMQRHATDEGVFIRSLGSRGLAGGLSRSAAGVVAVLAAGGYSLVLVETVGAGQAEVDVAGAADVTVVVMAPGLGDDIQTMKAGILEIADVFVLNKADRPGADQARRDLQAMLDLRHASGAGPDDVPRASAAVPIILTVGTSGEGISELAAAIDLAGQGVAFAGVSQRRRRAEARIRGIVIARTDAFVREALRSGGEAAALADDVATHGLDADAAADALMVRLRERY